MEKLLNLNENEFNEKENKNSIFTLKCRKEMISLAFECPLSIKNFLINFQNYDEKIFADFIVKINNDNHLCGFVKNAEALVQSRIFYTGVNYVGIFNSIFGYDEKYLANAMELEKGFGYCCLRYLYIVINYIEDNFPVVARCEMNFEEKKFVEFLLCSGDENAFMNQYGVEKDDLEKILQRICENYGCCDINTALNLILIEKYLKGENITFLNLIDVLK